MKVARSLCAVLVMCLSLAAVGLSTASLQGCSALGLTQQDNTPDTPRDKIAKGYATISTIADTLKTAKQNGLITESQRNEYAAKLNKAIADLDEAQQAFDTFKQTGNADTHTKAQQNLKAADDILQLLQKTLKAKGAGG